MPEMPDVIPGADVDADWGNLIRSRTIQRYASVAVRTSQNPSPQDGDMSYLADVDEISFFDGAAWRVLVPQDVLDDALLLYDLSSVVDSKIADAMAPSAWRAPTLLNGWSNFGAGEQTARIRREPNDLVRVQGLITGGTTTVNTPIFNLSGSETPDQNFQISTTSNNAYGQIKVNAAGTVVYRVGSAANLSLDGVYSLV